MDRLKALLDKKEAKLTAMRKITADAQAEDRLELTEAEQRSFDALATEVDTITASIDREKTLREAEATFEVEEIPDAPAQITGGVPAIMQDPKRGFAHFGEYARAVVLGSATKKAGGPTIDERLATMMAAAPGTDYAQEAVGADGGFLVPPDFSADVRSYALGEEALLPLTQNDPVTGNGMKFPVSEQTPWGTTGVRAYWEGEAGLTTNTKPILESRELRLRKLLGLVPATEEIIEDSTFMASWLPRQLGVSIQWKTNDAIVNGNGTGQPEGFINSGSIVEQAKEGSQAADTILAANVAKMYARNLNPTRAVWLINPDSFNQIMTMVIGDRVIWTPPERGFVSAPNGFLLGRPLLMSETCQTLGDAGDIYFADLTSYQTITKSGGGIDFATSMHLWFDYDMLAFRARFRIDGQSVFRAAVTPPNSTVTRSPFVRLAARA